MATHLAERRGLSSRRSETPTFAERHERLAQSLEAVGVPTVDTRELICLEDVCPMIVQNMLVYRDNSHLTATYSKWLAPMTRFLFQRHPTEQTDEA